MACWSHCLLLLLLFNLRLPFSSGKSDGVCTSQGGRFPPFSSQGKPPKRASKGSKDMTLCRVFRKKTCCDATQTYPASLNLRKLASTGEAGRECLHLWELLECSICEPTIGVRSGPPTLCASFCENVFDACADAYFSLETATKVLTPCGVNDFVCGRASKWVHNGTELCQSAGFAVKDDYHLDETCYGGKASLDLIADSWKASRLVVPQKGGVGGVLDDFQQWAAEMPFNERVSWAVGGMVLTAGLLFLSKRKSYRHAQKLGAIQQNARKLEMMNMRHRYFVDQGYNKASKR